MPRLEGTWHASRPARSAPPQDRQRRRGGAPDPRRRHRRHRRFRRHRLRRGHRGRARGALPRDPGRMRQRLATRAHARLCGRAGRRQGTRAQPLRPCGAGQARRRRPLGAGAQAAGARDAGRDRGLQPAAGRHRPSVSRHRGRQAGHAEPRGPRHLRRPASRRRQGQCTHGGEPRAADADRRRGGAVLQGLPDPRRHHSRDHRRPRRQPHDGARSAHPRGARHRDGSP